MVEGVLYSRCNFAILLDGVVLDPALFIIDMDALVTHITSGVVPEITVELYMITAHLQADIVLLAYRFELFSTVYFTNVITEADVTILVEMMSSVIGFLDSCKFTAIIYITQKPK